MEQSLKLVNEIHNLLNSDDFEISVLKEKMLKIIEIKKPEKWQFSIDLLSKLISIIKEDKEYNFLKIKVEIVQNMNYFGIIV